MIITAKFASVCPCCQCAISVGSRVEWSKGAKAIHAACVGCKPVAGGSAAPVRAATSRPTRGRAWRPCGYPGCHQSYCDDCDGKGAGGDGRYGGY